jgi:serine/threonine protein kinase
VLSLHSRPLLRSWTWNREVARSLDADKLPRPFGPYTLVRKLATGGMAEVYVARARGLGGFEKAVALKVIHPQFGEDEHFVRMLVDEAKLSVLLTHANIAQTFDLGCVDGRYFILMELVEGADASKLVKKSYVRGQQLPIEAAVYITQHTASGLDYAHKKKASDGTKLEVIHRDVSPQNVLVSLSGEVKVADFGIAKAALRTSETEVGVIKGKYYYMSPEQAWADPMDHRSDIFSTGVVLYELLTGRMLYQLEDNLPQLLDRVRKAQVEPPSRHRPEIPRELDQVVLKALARKPDDRYATSADFASALERVLFNMDPGYGATKLARIMATHFGTDPVGESEVMPTKATAVGSLPVMKSREFAPEHTSVIFDLNALRGSEPPRRPSSSQAPRPKRIVVEETIAKPTFDPRDEPVIAPPREDDEDEATTFYSRDEMNEKPASSPSAKRPAQESRGPQRGFGEVRDRPTPPAERRKPISEPPPDEATVIDSSGEFASQIESVLSGAPRRLNADAPMMVEQRAIRVWSPPKPTWDPLPFVGPPLPVSVRPQSSFTFAKKNVYMAVGLFVLAFGLTTLLLLLRH